MTYLRCILLFFVLFSDSSFAKQQNFVEWLIYPAQAESPGIELPTESGPWRLLRADGSLLAEMHQPRLKPGYSFNFGQCRINGFIRDDMIAMVRHVKVREWSKDVITVWIADPKTGRFTVHTGRNIECRNEGYGVWPCLQALSRYNISWLEKWNTALLIYRFQPLSSFLNQAEGCRRYH